MPLPNCSDLAPPPGHPLQEAGGEANECSGPPPAPHRGYTLLVKQATSDLHRRSYQRNVSQSTQMKVPGRETDTACLLECGKEAFFPRALLLKSLYQEQDKVENCIPEKKQKRYNFANKQVALTNDKKKNFFLNNKISSIIPDDTANPTQEERLRTRRSYWQEGAALGRLGRHQGQPAAWPQPTPALRLGEVRADSLVGCSCAKEEPCVLVTQTHLWRWGVLDV